jgi:hypothetical protein
VGILIGPRQTRDIRGIEIHRVEPLNPMEHEEIEVFFTVSNLGDREVSGVVRPLYGDKQAKITLGPKGTISRSVKALAPAAGSDTVGVTLQYFGERVGSQEFPPLEDEATIQVTVAARYVVRIDQLDIYDTRANFDDHAFIALTVKVDDRILYDEENPLVDPAHPELPAQPQPIHWLDKGEVDEGTHPVGLTVPRPPHSPFDVLPSTTVGIICTVLNVGQDLKELGEFLNALSDASEQALELVFVGSNWDAANKVTHIINRYMTEGCNGLVALDTISKRAGDLNAFSAATGTYSETRRYPGTDIGPDQKAAYDPPWHCGEKSDYAVTYSFQRTTFRPS